MTAELKQHQQNGEIFSLQFDLKMMVHVASVLNHLVASNVLTSNVLTVTELVW